MEWLRNIFFEDSVAHSILILALAIAIGIILGKIKIKGVSLGITWILFAGIFLSHFGLRVNAETLHFVKEFGLILFVFSIGMQVGPGFFASFKKGGIKLNMLAASVVLLGGVVTYVIHLVTGTSLTTMVGVMSGAVTNTPGLGAAQQTFMDATGAEDVTIPMGYAVAYPLGVIGIIMTIITIRLIFNIDLKREKKMVEEEDISNDVPVKIAVCVNNPAIFGKTIYEVDKLINKEFVVSRLYSCEGKMEIPTFQTIINEEDKLLVVTSVHDADVVSAFIGYKIDMEIEDWEKLDDNLVSRRILVSKEDINGKKLSELRIRSQYGVNITRINRAGVDLVASPDLQLLIGDRVTVVGTEEAINKTASVLGNSLKRLREPNLFPIFLGIALGVLLGSIPFRIPGIPQAVKLGLAGGPLIIAILISKFGPKYKLITYTTMGANLMLREVGISLFLAAVGLSAGEGFIETIVNGGYSWILYGVLITVIPLLIAGIIGRKALKLDYFTLAGLMAGSTTDPPALSYTNSTLDSTKPAVAYATVYPLTMFLRVLIAQIMILMAF